MEKILLTEPIHEKGIELLKSKYEIIGPDDYTDEDIIDMAPEISGIIVRAQYIPEEIYKKDNKLKIISKHGTGVDNINIPLASDKNILVTNTPGANSNAVAEYVVALMMILARKVCQASSFLNSDENEIDGHNIIGEEIQNKTLGIFGLGSIGGMIAEKCGKGLGMKIIGIDPYCNKERANKLGVELLDNKEDLLEKSDYVSLNLPLNDNTRGYISLEELNSMKKSAYLINTSRGGVINEEDLAKALNEGIIAGAALDVLTNEPPAPDNPLLEAKNLFRTPHIGAQTEEAMITMALESVHNLIDALEGRKPNNILTN